MSALLAHTHIAHRLLRRIGRGFDAYCVRKLQRGEPLRVSAFSDHALHDIGLTREDLERTLRSCLDRDPF
ncbi:MAG: DUF1127 domain-containing protein [Pseudomonadota bacterium]